MWNTVLFDLDGTLTDSAEGIAKSVQYALHTLGIEEPDTQKLRSFVGPPLHAYFMEYAHLSSEEASRAVKAYREHYNREGMYINAVYQYIPDLLLALRRNGCTLGVVTSKETSQAVAILQRYNLARFFDTVTGCTVDNTNASKSELIGQALKTLRKENEKEHVVMVGDRFYDIDGAKGAGVSAVGAAYGYGTYEELSKSGADYIAANVTELGNLLLRFAPGGAQNANGQQMNRTPYGQNAAGYGQGNAPGGAGYGPSPYGIRRNPGYGSTPGGAAPAAPTPMQNVWRIIYPILIWFGISTLVSGIGGGIYGAYKAIQYAGQGMENIDPNVIVESLLNELNGDVMFRLNMILSGVGNLVMIPMFYTMRKKDHFARTGKTVTLRTEKKPGVQNAVLAAVMGFSISVVINVLISMTGIAEWMYEMNPDRYDMMGSVSPLESLIILSILAPILEELLFRSIIFKRMREWTGLLPAALVSAVIFGFVHLDIVTGIAAFLIGVIMAYMLEYTDCIFVSMFFHFGFNLYSSLLEIVGIESMPEQTASAIMLGLFAVCIVLAAMTGWLFYKKNIKK